MIYNIPSSDLKAFEYFIDLPDKLKDALINGIKKAPSGLLPKKLANHLSSEIEVDETKLHHIVGLSRFAAEPLIFPKIKYFYCNRHR